MINAIEIEKRFKLLGLLVLAMILALFFRMAQKQIFEHDQYVAMADEQQRFESTETAQRGRIYARDFIEDNESLYPLAFDVKSYAVLPVPKNIEDKEDAAKKLSELLNLKYQDIFSKINNDKIYIPPIERGLNYDLAQKVKDLDISGILIMPEYDRFYPEQSLASQVLGFVNSEGKGNYGFEGHYNSELEGTSGKITGEKDTLGRIINLLNQENPEDGTSYVLTIDRSVQYFVEKKLAEAVKTYEADSGTVVIMDIATGGVVAMANYPSYNPNNYQKQAEKDPSLFVNPAISSWFEPGSIFKPIVMAAALDKGAVKPETEETFGASVKVGNHTISTAEGEPFGKENMTQILQNSDNVAMVWVSEKLGNDEMYKYISDFGFSERTGIDLDVEVAGDLKPLNTWMDIDRATMAFGQGISTTAIEMVSAYATIANGGKYIYPHIVDKIIAPDGTERQIEKREGRQVISEKTAKTMSYMLYQVVESGHSKKAAVAGFKVAAKTGTAQIPKDDGSGYLDSEDKLGIYNHSLAGFAPYDDPKYAMIVKLTKPKTAKYAESTSAPLFSDISSFLLNFYYRVTPNS